MAGDGFDMRLIGSAPERTDPRDRWLQRTALDRGRCAIAGAEACCGDSYRGCFRRYASPFGGGV